MLAAVGCPYQAHFAGMAHQLFPEGFVRFLVSSCLGMSQILICQERHGPRGSVSWHPCNPEQQNWQCPQQKGARASLSVSTCHSVEKQLGLLRGTGLSQGLQPKQGLEMSQASGNLCHPNLWK